MLGKPRKRYRYNVLRLTLQVLLKEASGGTGRADTVRCGFKAHTSEMGRPGLGSYFQVVTHLQIEEDKCLN